jgi:endonuclease YncB( thermonuclease family)
VVRACGRTPKNVDLVFLFSKEGSITMTQKRIIKYILGYIKKPSIFGLLVIFGLLIYQIYGCDLHDRPYVNDNVRVVDGDTLVLDNELRIRLQGIDAPETKQQCADLFDGEKKYFLCGEVASMRLTRIIGRNKVECTNEGKDKYKRQLSYCYVNGENINRRMVREGYAFAYSEYDRTFVLDELIARIRKDGLWNSEFEKPSDWRKKQKQNRSK